MASWDLKRRVTKWWMTGKVPQFLVPLRLRRWWFRRRALRAAQAHHDKLRDEMLKEIDQAGNDEDYVSHILHHYELNVMAGAERRLFATQMQPVIDAADRFGVEFDPTSMWIYEGDNDQKPNRVAASKLRRDVYEERWRRRQRWVSVIVPVLSLLVALVALLLKVQPQQNCP
jgi:hypothetical protein